MINHKHKIIFIHIPKTAGTSIEKAIDGRDWWSTGEKHMTYSQSKKVYKKYWDKYFKFSVVRNPWDMLVSWYKWRKLKCDYKEYILKYNHLSRGVPATSAADYLLSSNNELQVDYICKFENLHKDFEIVCEKANIKDVTLPLTNKSKHKHYTEYYDDEARQIVAERYARDIECFDYKFGK